MRTIITALGGSDFPAMLENYESNLSKVRTILSKVLTTLTIFSAAVEEGFNKADQYETLARKSDRELAALGLSRKDLLRFIGLA
jgi:uncharacterized protein YjiS (DUF1127 family)